MKIYYDGLDGTYLVFRNLFEVLGDVHEGRGRQVDAGGYVENFQTIQDIVEAHPDEFAACYPNGFNWPVDVKPIVRVHHRKGCFPRT